MAGITPVASSSATAKGTTGATSTISLVGAQQIASGNLVIVNVAWFENRNPGTLTISVSDSGGNTYTAIGSIQRRQITGQATSINMQAFYCKSATASATSITATWSASTDGFGWGCARATGQLTPDPLSTASGNPATNAGSTSTATVSNPPATDAADAFIVAFLADGSATSADPYTQNTGTPNPPGWTKWFVQGDNTAGQDMYVGYVGSGGGIANGATWQDSVAISPAPGDWIMKGAVFLPATGGGSTPSATDSATVAATPSLAAAIPASDSATASDTSTLAAAIPTSDAASLTETLQIGVAITDAATETESSTLTTQTPGTDSGTVSEVASPTAQGSGADSGSSSEIASTTAAIASSDSGTESEIASIAAGLSSSDSATFSETTTLIAQVSVSDAATFTDSASVQAPGQPTGSDSGALAETTSLTASGSASDTAALSEDTALNAALAFSDNATSTESTSLAATSSPSTDTATLGESWSVTVSISAQDSVGGIESLSQQGALVGSDGAALTDSASVSISGVFLVSASDLFTMSELQAVVFANPPLVTSGTRTARTRATPVTDGRSRSTPYTDGRTRSTPTGE